MHHGTMEPPPRFPTLANPANRSSWVNDARRIAKGDLVVKENRQLVTRIITQPGPVGVDLKKQRGALHD